MSDLKRMMRAFAISIIRYNEAQTYINKSAPSLLKKPHEELLSNLKELIEEATKIYKDRAPILDYLLHLVQKFKPLADQSTPLNDSDYEEIEKVLVEFILNMQILTKESQRKEIPIKYDKDPVVMIGFQRPLRGYSYCVSAQTIEKNIFTPFELSFETPESEVRETIKALVDAHKIEVRETYDLQEKLNGLQVKTERLENENKLVKELEEKLLAAQQKEKELERLQEKHSELEAKYLAAEEKANRLEKELGQLQEKHSSLEAKYLAVEEKANRLEELEKQFEEMKRQVSSLEQENTELKEKPEVSQNKTDSAEPFKGSDDLLRLIGNSSRDPMLPAGIYTQLLGTNGGTNRPFRGLLFPPTSQSSPSSNLASLFPLTPGGNGSNTNP
jgi:myosin heavy subunit